MLIKRENLLIQVFKLNVIYRVFHLNQWLKLIKLRLSSRPVMKKFTFLHNCQNKIKSATIKKDTGR